MAASEYSPTIGLEIHAELKTNTKMFCGCLNDPDEKRPNVNICPVCMAHPGTLPVINREAVHKVLQVGTALGSQLADFTEFDRKNYFYPDIPKGYQISQYKYPLVSGGVLNGVAITRVHLEEDTARSQHEGEKSLVDYNRAGVPLMELVTEPVVHSAEQAGAFARELRLLLKYLDASEANMEKGEMRVEANISVSKNSTFGTKVEVKNLNSFRSVERAIAYEVERQIKVIEAGEKVVQETRGWDDTKQVTFSQRKKESSHDYRYFPDPDLPKLILSDIPEFSKEILLSKIEGKLPWHRRERYIAMGLRTDDANLFVTDPVLGDFFDRVVSTVNKEEALLAANYLGSDLNGKREKDEVGDDWFTEANAVRLGTLMQMTQSGALSSRGAKDLLTVMLTETGEPEALATKHKLLQQSDEGFLTSVVKMVIEAHPTVAADFRAGKVASLQFLVGQGMKESKGTANPGALKTLFEAALK